MRFIRRNIGLVLIIVLVIVFVMFLIWQQVSNALPDVETLEGVIVYAADGDNGRDIFVRTLNDAETPPRLLSDLPSSAEYHPMASPDGQFVVFETVTNGQHDIFMALLASGNGLSIARTPDDELSPSWSPDSQQVVFVRETEGNASLYTMTPQGENLVRLTDGGGNDIDPSWSPDGRSIAYVSDRNGNNDLYILDVRSCETVDGISTCSSRQVTAGAGNDRWPSWSPDGRSLAFISDSNGTPSMYTINLRNNDIVQITIGAEDARPNWSPDGARILFDSTNRDGTGGLFMYDVRDESITPAVVEGNNERAGAWISERGDR